MNAQHMTDDAREYLATVYEEDLEWHTQENIIELVRIFGRDIAQEKVAEMLLIAFKETGR